MSSEMDIQKLEKDLKALLQSHFLGEAKQSELPREARQAYRDHFFESHPVTVQIWLVLSSSLDRQQQNNLILKLLMYRNINPLEWLYEWLPGGGHAFIKESDMSSGNVSDFLDQSVEKPLLSHISEKRHVSWLLKVVKSQEDKITKRLNRLWANMSLVKTLESEKSLWIKMIQYTLTWRSSKKNAHIGERLREDLQKQIDELSARATFDDFESFVSILAEKYRGVGATSKNKKNSRPPMDDRMRILRRVSFWTNYRNQTSVIRFLLTRNDYDTYHSESMENLLLGDEFISVCDSLPADAPLMIIGLGRLIVVSSLTDGKQPTYFIPVKNINEPHELLHLSNDVRSAQLEAHIRQEDPYYHQYLWQVLFTIILEGGGISPDHPEEPFVLGGDKVSRYIINAGLKFSTKELQQQESQLTMLLKERPDLLEYLSDCFGEPLLLP